MSAVSASAQAMPVANTSAGILPELQQLVLRLPQAQQAQALQEIARLTPAQQQQLLAQVMQSQAQASQQNPQATGADQATLGAQAAGAPQPSLGKTILKNVLLFGGVGAALGFGATFIPGLNWSGPIAAAIGGGIGAVIGAVKGLLSFKKAAKANAEAAQQQNPNAAQQPVVQDPSAAKSPEPSTKDSLSSSPKVSSESKSSSYVVKRGDTLSSIAKRHETTWQKLYENNKKVVGSNPNKIFPGQKLKLL